MSCLGHSTLVAQTWEQQRCFVYFQQMSSEKLLSQCLLRTPWRMAPVLIYWPAQETEAHRVIPSHSVKPLYDPVTHHCKLLILIPITLSNPSGSFKKPPMLTLQALVQYLRTTDLGHSYIVSTVIYKCSTVFHLELSLYWQNILITCSCTCSNHKSILRLHSFLSALFHFPKQLLKCFFLWVCCFLFFRSNQFSYASGLKKVPWAERCMEYILN